MDANDAHAITTLPALQAVIGKAPPAIHLKVIDHLDATALHWIAQSTLAFVGFGSGHRMTPTLAGGPRGFAGGDARTLRLPLDTIDDAPLARPGAPFCALFLAPGIGETLRVNGRVAEIVGDAAVIAVEECYVHCAKALIRSAFWAAQPAEAPPDAPAFAAAARFMALATIDGDGHADMSPKGDPAGCMVQLDGDRLLYADRPGNRRVDSFRNIIDQPAVGALLLVPGATRVLRFSGRARISTDPALLARFTVSDKVPLLVTCVDLADIAVTESPALARAAMWPLGDRAEAINPAKMFVAHVKLNKDQGLAARIAGSVISIPGLMQKGLDKDYKSNLY